MYKIQLIILIITSSLCSAQQVDKKEVLVNELFQLTKMKESCEMLIVQLINKVKENHPTKTNVNWQNVKNKINYTSFITDSKKVYTSNYTEIELKELVSLYKSNKIVEYQNKTKKIESQLYQLGKKFGQDIIVQINKLVN